MKKISEYRGIEWIRNKVTNKNSFFKSFFTSILKVNLAVALLLMAALLVNAGDFIVENGNLYIVDPADKVGIGTETPASQLHVKDTSANAILVVDSGDDFTGRFSAVDFYDNGAPVWGIGKNNFGDFYIDQAGVDTALFIAKSNSFFAAVSFVIVLDSKQSSKFQ